MISYVLTDIEGTTTPIDFVHKVLFPYSLEHLSEFVKKWCDRPEVIQCLMKVNETAKEELGFNVAQTGAIALLEKWIAEDRKHPALKTLQGLIWKQGYALGAFTSAVYPDVFECLPRWKAAGRTLGVYSSGSVDAQKLLFAHTEQGDLNHLFTDYFDTAVGGKKEDQSYHNIVAKLDRPAHQILFLSDVPEELDAAKTAGMQTMQIVREGSKATTRHQTAADFYEVERKFSVT